MIIAGSVMAALVIAVFLFMQQPKFGRSPTGNRLEKIKQSPNYKNGSFKNLNPTPDITEGVSYFTILKEFLFTKKVRIIPADEIPSVKTGLLNLDPEKNVLVWFGHSSYFLQVDGKKILVDPVFSGAASPLSFTTKAFRGADIYKAGDTPVIDYLFISHDHWDHLDHKTVKQLRPKIKKVICGLGVGEHLERWGYAKNKIIEKDWNEKEELGDGFSITTTTARHFSGRGFKRNQSLWLSYVLKTPTMKIFIGGDSGYDTHFAGIGKTEGGFDLVILENGQYDKNWKYTHMMPEEVLQAAKDLKAKRLFPVHSSKFHLANHPWDEPLERITASNKKETLSLLTPIIGEQVNLGDSTQTFREWWSDIK